MPHLLERKDQVNRIRHAFFSAFRPPNRKAEDDLERITVHLEAALHVANDTKRTEEDRIAELRKRIRLMPVE